MTGYIYAVECGGRIKIGFSEDPQRRFNKIASDAPFPCDLLGSWPGSVSEELAFQEQFKIIRVHGEWFAATEALLSAIRDRVVPIEDSTVRYSIRENDSALAVWFKANRGMQVRLARHLGLQPSTVSQWRSVPVEHLPEVSNFTGIPREDLLPDAFRPAREAAQ